MVSLQKRGVVKLLFFCPKRSCPSLEGNGSVSRENDRFYPIMDYLFKIKFFSCHTKTKKKQIKKTYKKYCITKNLVNLPGL